MLISIGSPHMQSPVDRLPLPMSFPEERLTLIVPEPADPLLDDYHGPESVFPDGDTMRVPVIRHQLEFGPLF